MVLVCFIQVLEIILVSFGVVLIINLRLSMISLICHILVILWIILREEVRKNLLKIFIFFFNFLKIPISSFFQHFIPSLLNYNNRTSSYNSKFSIITRNSNQIIFYFKFMEFTKYRTFSKSIV